MSNPTYTALSSETRASDALTQLALDLHWSWNHSADEVWKRLDPELWELTGNPWLILQAISQRELDHITDSGFLKRVESLLEESRAKTALRAGFKQLIRALHFVRSLTSAWSTCLAKLCPSIREVWATLPAIS
jgi:glycogen phosphorylase